ncbi:MAG: hypothetical protein EOO90_15990 [Pedobacter sp.]|nr:MAG: hypothetical protein EOO90_15990 [Pedobacter sp.]
MKPTFSVENFLKAASIDSQLYPTHISLFTAIYYYSRDEPELEFRISRKKLMQYSKIKSIATYHKCLSYLVQAGYLIYKPSFNPAGSFIRIV